ncbi:MAG: glycerate kinase [Lachnospiraceae bacterium]|nr:glycerate kinase [Lachnospiraceae bacterium]
MKTVIAIDSFKGSLTSIEAGNAIKKGILNILPDTDVIIKPLADGGEGTTEALVEGLGGEMIQIDVHGPLEASVKAGYGIIPETNTAVMEMAAAAGIILVGKDKRPLDATTYGVGEMIADAVKRGCRSFIIGIGGSATNDGGIGMLAALGYEFLDKNGQPAGISADALKNIASVRTEKVMPELKECRFRIACDVTNPLCGPNGATYIYGPQKGVTDEIKANLDHAMAGYAKLTRLCTGTDYMNYEGAGAAGGLGFAFLSYLHADLQPGIRLVMDAVKMEDAIKGADLVFTGEGRLDHQSAMGKAVTGIAKLAKKHGAPVIALAGAVTDGAEECNHHGIDAFFPILRQITTLDEAMDPDTAKQNLTKTAEQIIRLIAAVT